MDNYTLRKEHVINEAITAGKFGEDRRSFWSSEYDRDPAGTEHTLASLVPATEGTPPYPPELFPHLSQRRRPPMRSARVAATVPTLERPLSAEEVDAAVTGWTRQLFPESRAAAAGRRRIVRCND